MADVKPRYEVHKLEGKAMRRLAKSKTDKEGKLLGGFDYEEVEHDAGWMVYFPSGSSIRVWTKEEMERQGFDLPPAMIDMETGDVTAPMSSTSLKAKSEQKNTRASKRSSAESATAN